MTHLITVATKRFILMASDTRLNYHEESIENGQTYMLIKLVADCCRKTFFLNKIKIGIQFIGIGYLRGNDWKKYHLSHFLPLLQNGIKQEDEINFKFKKIYENLRKMATPGDTSNYINGVMAGFYRNTPYIASFNTFNKDDSLGIYPVYNISFVDSEQILDLEKLKQLKTEKEIIEEINNAIKLSSKNKPHLIGEEVEILKITNEEANYIQESKNLFFGNYDELMFYFNNNLSAINGQILPSPIKEKINL